MPSISLRLADGASAPASKTGSGEAAVRWAPASSAALRFVRRFFRCSTEGAMLDLDYWFDFEVASRRDLKADGAFRYATDASTRAIILAYAVGDGPELAWHADGEILDWRHA